MTDPTPEARELDAYWVATSGAMACWAYLLYVQPFREDIEAATEARDWPLAIEAASLMLKEVGFALLVLRGYVDIPFEADLNLSLLALDHDLLEDMARIPRSFGADESAARRAIEIATAAEGDLRARLPISVPTLRTPEGFFPTMKVAADLDRLREGLGVPFDLWPGWVP